MFYQVNKLYAHLISILLKIVCICEKVEKHDTKRTKNKLNFKK